MVLSDKIILLFFFFFNKIMNTRNSYGDEKMQSMSTYFEMILLIGKLEKKKLS